MRIAVFDLDGTITRRDTLLPYLLGWRRRHARTGYYGQAFGALLHFVADRDRGRLKSALIRAAMSGVTRDEVERWTAEYVASIVKGELCRVHLRRLRVTVRPGTVSYCSRPASTSTCRISGAPSHSTRRSARRSPGLMGDSTVGS
jgi:phosphoserine phosphatase